MDFETFLILGILSGLAGTAISLLIWFIQLFVNRKKSLTTGKVTLCLWAITVISFLIFCWRPNQDIEFFANFLASVFAAGLAGALSLIVLIPMAIVNHLEKKKAEREEEFPYAPYTSIPQPSTPRYSAYNTRPESTRTEPIVTYKQPERPTLNKPEYIPEPFSSVPNPTEKRAPKQEKKVALNEKPGYNAVYRELKSRENGGAKFLFNVQLPDSSTPIDTIMIDPYGVFVLKDSQTNDANDAIAQNTRNTNLLQSHIAMRDVPFHNLVIFSESQKVQDNNPYVVLLPNLQNKVKELSYTHSLCLLSSDINQIYQKLLPYTQDIETTQALYKSNF